MSKRIPPIFVSQPLSSILLKKSNCIVESLGHDSGFEHHENIFTFHEKKSNVINSEYFEELILSPLILQ